MKGIKVRVRQREDREAVQNILGAAARTLRADVGGNAGTAAVDPLRIQASEGIVASVNGSIVGTVSYRIRSGRLHLFDLTVVPKFRRKGVARLLLERLAEIATESRAKKLTLQTIEEAGMQPVFERLGFRVQSTKQEFMFAAERDRALTTVYMVKRLDGVSYDNNGKWW